MSHEPSNFELERIGASLAVPTRDDQVIEALRGLGEKLEPSESAASRRRRLLLITAKRHIQGQITTNDSPEEVAIHNKQTVSKVSNELFKARENIQRTSKQAAQNRLEFQVQQAQLVKTHNIEELNKLKDLLTSQIASISSLECRGVESGFSRPVSAVAFAGPQLYAGDWSGKISTIDYDKVEVSSVDQQHAGKVCLCNWRGGLLSGGLEGNIKFSKSVTLESSYRVANVDGHPTLDLVAGAYFDKTWKLWDITKGIELLGQTGHSKEVFTAKFHPDGSLIATGGLDGQAMVWDLRSGQSILKLEKHVGEIYALDWCNDGYNLATGGADNNVIVWDIRQQTSRMIPAHTSIISSIKYIDSIIATGSYDKTVKFWNSKTGSLINKKLLSDKVMSIDYSDNQLAVGKWDRTVDVWAAAS